MPIIHGQHQQLSKPGQAVPVLLFLSFLLLQVCLDGGSIRLPTWCALLLPYCPHRAPLCEWTAPHTRGECAMM